MSRSKSSKITKISKIYACDFEVSGKVQDVAFPEFAQKRANELELRGWCGKTEKNTIAGQIEGKLASVYKMRQWLQNKGSPESTISNATFSNIEEVRSHKFKKFNIQ